MKMGRNESTYQKLIQIPDKLRLTTLHVPQVDRSVGTSREKLFSGGDHAADVLLVANANGLNDKGLGKLADEDLLIAIAGGQVTLGKGDIGDNGSAMTTQNSLLHIWKGKRHQISNLISNNHVLNVIVHVSNNRACLFIHRPTTKIGQTVLRAADLLTRSNPVDVNSLSESSNRQILSSDREGSVQNLRSTLNGSFDGSSPLNYKTEGKTY